MLSAFRQVGDAFSRRHRGSRSEAQNAGMLYLRMTSRVGSCDANRSDADLQGDVSRPQEVREYY